MLTDKHISYLTSLNGGGWSSTEKKRRLYDLVVESQKNFPDTHLKSVELGVFAGVSLFCMQLAHKDIGNGTVTGIETWDNAAPLEGENSKENNEWWANLDMEYIKRCFYKTAEFLGLPVGVIIGKSYESAKFFDDDSVTLLHQDGTHNEEVITKELEAWTPKMKLGSFWIVDDTNWKEVEGGYAKLPSFGFELVENYDTWAVYKKVK
jgi:hypothetical protein